MKARAVQELPQGTWSVLFLPRTAYVVVGVCSNGRSTRRIPLLPDRGHPFPLSPAPGLTSIRVRMSPGVER